MNGQWQLATFITVLLQQQAGQNQLVDANIPEVQDLVSRGYFELRPELGQNGTAVVVRAVEAADVTPANLARDLGIDDATAQSTYAAHGIAADYAPFASLAAVPAPAIAAPTVAEVQQAAAAVQPTFHDAPAPTAPAFAEPAQVAPAVQQTLGVAPVPAPVAQPLGTAPAAPAVQPAYSANAEVLLGTGQQHQVVGQAESKNGTFEIEVGIPFHKKATGFVKGQGRNAEWKPAYPFNEIAENKIQSGIHSDQLPSFHVAGKEVRDMSTQVKRANEVWEAKEIAGTTDRITFRSANVGAEDPKGAGVRVYAMALSTAPAIRKRKPKEGQA